MFFEKRERSELRFRGLISSLILTSATLKIKRIFHIKRCIEMRIKLLIIVTLLSLLTIGTVYGKSYIEEKEGFDLQKIRDTDHIEPENDSTTIAANPPNPEMEPSMRLIKVDSRTAELIVNNPYNRTLRIDGLINIDDEKYHALSRQRFSHMINASSIYTETININSSESTLRVSTTAWFSADNNGTYNWPVSEIQKSQITLTDYNLLYKELANDNTIRSILLILTVAVTIVVYRHEKKK